MTIKKYLQCLVAGLITLCVVAPLAAQVWSGSGRIKGTVKAVDGSPIKDAKVYFKMAGETESGPEPFVTNKKGKFAFLGLKGGTWIVSVEAEGYEPWSTGTEVYSTGVSDAVNAVLTPVPEEVLLAQRRFKAQERLDKAKELINAGDIDGAVAEYEAALNEVDEKDHPVVLSNLGNLYLSIGELDKAKATFDRALAIDPENVSSLKGECALVAAAGNFVEAEALLAKIPETESVHPNTTMNIGMAHYNLGEMEQAKVFLDRTVRDHPDVAQAYYFRGLICLSLDEREIARGDFERFIEMAPDSPQATEAKEYLSYLVPSE